MQITIILGTISNIVKIFANKTGDRTEPCLTPNLIVNILYDHVLSQFTHV